MVRITATYDGDLRCTATHGPSGNAFPTDAPVDNQGRGESFSPTDLVGTALGTCILTTVGIVARREGIDLRGSTVTVDKAMTTEGPRRIASLVVDVRLSVPRSADAKGVLERAARACPVHRSLHPDVVQDIRIGWAPEPS